MKKFSWLLTGTKQVYVSLIHPLSLWLWFLCDITKTHPELSLVNSTVPLWINKWCGYIYYMSTEVHWMAAPAEHDRSLSFRIPYLLFSLALCVSHTLIRVVNYCLTASVLVKKSITLMPLFPYQLASVQNLLYCDSCCSLNIELYGIWLQRASVLGFAALLSRNA